MTRMTLFSAAILTGLVQIPARSLRADDAAKSMTGRQAARANEVAGTSAAQVDIRSEGLGHDIGLFSLNADEVEKAQYNDALEVSRHMYNLNDDEFGTASKVLSTAVRDSWKQGPQDEKLRALFDRRAGLYNKLREGFPVNATPDEIAKLATSNPDFNRLNISISAIDRTSPHGYREYAILLESVLPPERVAQAAADWETNAATLPLDRIAMKSMVAGVRAGSHDDFISGVGPGGPRTSAEKLRLMREQRDRTHADKSRAAADRLTGGQPRKPVAKPQDDVKTPVALGGNNKTDVAPTAPRPAATTPKPAAAAPRQVRRESVKPTPVKAPPARPLNEWEKYVLDFIERYELTTTQRNAAMAILRDMTARAQQIQSANADRMKAAEAMTDARAKSERIKELNAPIDGLFERMKLRLENLLTAAQREMADKKPAPKR